MAGFRKQQKNALRYTEVQQKLALPDTLQA